jgi:nucleotide-binding universal stress UspA family protein
MTHVLVPVDFSMCSRGAFDYGAALARGLGGGITALHVAPYQVAIGEWSDLELPPSRDPERWQSLQDELRDLTEYPEGPAASIAVREGDPAEEILSWATDHHVDYIVMGTHGRRGIRRLLLGSVTEAVARAARCPVIAVPHGVHASFKRVLCALDLSEDSEETVANAATIARAMGAHLILLHAAPSPSPYEPWMISPDDEEAARIAVGEEGRARLADLVARHVHDGLTVEWQLTIGHPAERIEQAVRAGASLVAMGARSSHAVEQFFFGSTARHVLRAALAPVMLVPHRVSGGGAGDREHEDALVAP